MGGCKGRKGESKRARERDLPITEHNSARSIVAAVQPHHNEVRMHVMSVSMTSSLSCSVT